MIVPGFHRCEVCKALLPDSFTVTIPSTPNSDAWYWSNFNLGGCGGSQPDFRPVHDRCKPFGKPSIFSSPASSGVEAPKPTINGLTEAPSPPG